MSEVDLTTVGSPTRVQVYVTEDAPTNLQGAQLGGPDDRDRDPRCRSPWTPPSPGRYVVVWLTSLPAVGGGFRGEIAEVVVKGELTARPTTAPTPTCWPPTSPATPTPSPRSSPATATGCGRSPLRTMGNPHDAADGLQDGLVAAYRRADSFRGDAAVTTWLHRVVVNACLDRLRAAKVRRADALPDDLDDHRDRGSSYTSTSPVDDPEQAAVADDRRRAGAGGARDPARRPAGRAGAGRHGGLPGRRGGGDARLRRGHREVAVLPRPGPAGRRCSATGWPTSTGRPTRVSEVTRNPRRPPTVRSLHPRPPSPLPAKEVPP